MVLENDSETNSDQTDLNLTAFIEALDLDEPETEDRAGSRRTAFDPNATMDYQQAGMPYPELPFANEDAEIDAAAQTPRERGGFARRPTGRHPDEISGSQSMGRIRTSPSHTAARASSKTAARSSAPLRTRTPKKQQHAGTSDKMDPVFQPVNTRQSVYKIRGGGSRQHFNPRSPAFIVASALLVVIGIGIFIFAINSLTSSLSDQTTGVEFNLTTTQTREAIDSRIPVLMNYVDYDIAGIGTALTESGQLIYTNSRYQTDSPDMSAEGSEIVSMPGQMTEEQMIGYYEGSYNAYSIEELVQYFNGMYVLDMARGDLGSWNRLKYVNFNATSLEDEMTHLADIQQLSGDTIEISAQGIDSRGNRVVQGQKAVNEERVLYFKIAACPFKDVYTVQTLSDASVYITCTVATYDFYSGADTITPE
ncbi:MAG: hypothetical protein LBL23_06495 [Coriobacteriales bacterium]|jgi:hypothetical protein|nr:hypothetical protein [Coriobacteriales bacterium]